MSQVRGAREQEVLQEPVVGVEASDNLRERLDDERDL